MVKVSVSVQSLHWVLKSRFDWVGSFIGKTTQDFLRNVANYIEKQKEYSTEEMGAIIGKLVSGVLACGEDCGPENTLARFDTILLFLTVIAGLYGIKVHFTSECDPSYVPGEKPNNGKDMIS